MGERSRADNDGVEFGPGGDLQPSCSTSPAEPFRFGERNARLANDALAKRRAEIHRLARETAAKLSRLTPSSNSERARRPSLRLVEDQIERPGGG